MRKYTMARFTISDFSEFPLSWCPVVVPKIDILKSQKSAAATGNIQTYIFIHMCIYANV